MAVRRFDAASDLRKPTRTPEGWLRVDGYLTRTGVFTYRNPNGTERRELRLPEEVFKKDSLDTFALVPVTNGHPPVILNADNTKKYAVGAISEGVKQDGDHVQVSMMVTDADTIKDIENGRRQLSAGYLCELDFTPGTYKGERYDAVQRNIRGNHVAIVDRARAGSTACINMDQEDAAEIRVDTEAQGMKITINGVEYEVSEQVAQAITRERADAAEKLTTVNTAHATLKSDFDKLTAKCDAAEKKLGDVTKAHADAMDPVKFNERVAARTALLAQAQPILGPDVKLDSVDDLGVRKLVLAKLDPNIKIEGDKTIINGAARSDDYVSAYYDATVKTSVKTPENTGLAAARAAAANIDPATGKPRTDSKDDPRKAMIERNNKLGSEPIPGGFTVK